MYSGSAESTDLALNKLKELKLMSQSILLKKILMRLRVFRVSEWNKTYNKNNDLFYYVRWDGCSFINLDSMVKRKNL